MSNEPFDHIENKIREAAMHSEPPFNEMAWEKMEKKLERSEARRRPLFWWFIPTFILLLGGAGIWYWTNKSGGIENELSGAQPGKNLSHNSVQSEAKNSDKSILSGNGSTDINDKTKLQSSTVSPGVAIEASTFPSLNKNEARTKTAITGLDTRRKVSTKRKRNKKSDNSRYEINVSGSNPSVDDTADPVDAVEKRSSQIAKGDEHLIVEEKKLEDTAVIQRDETSKLTANDSVPSGVKEKVTGKRSDKTKKSGMYFKASVGPEVTAVSMSRANGRDITARFGLGVGYQFNNRVSIQTGIYSVAKKYLAGRDDYNPKDGSYLAGVEDLVVDANCRVIEIPLTLNYSLLNRSKTSWFISGGVAGAIMKKEQYKFTYTAGTYPYTATYTESKSFTGNRHFLSFAQFSTGISRKISSGISIVAEPYLTVPLQGVGEGRVKLFSGGIQFGIKYMPIKNKR